MFQQAAQAHKLLLMAIVLTEQVDQVESSEGSLS